MFDPEYATRTFVASVAVAAGFLLSIWTGLATIVQGLIILMAVDLVSGLFASYISRAWLSDTNLRGIAKKMLALLAVAACEVAGRLVLNIDSLGSAAAFGLCSWELMSIAENLALSGLPVPKALRDALVKLNPPETTTVTTVTTDVTTVTPKPPNGH